MSAKHTTRTWLCPDCGGWGLIDLNDSNPHGFGPDPQLGDDRECATCDSSGVIEATYEDADRRGLQPWDGYIGKVAEGVRAERRKNDPLLDMARLRAERKHPVGGDFYYRGYRTRAMRPVASRLRQAEMLATAQMCVNRMDEARAAYAKAVSA